LLPSSALEPDAKRERANSVIHAVCVLRRAPLASADGLKSETSSPVPTGSAAGSWRDAEGVASNQPGYDGPVYCRWYGFGRIAALAALKKLLSMRRQGIYAEQIDPLVRILGEKIYELLHRPDPGPIEKLTESALSLAVTMSPTERNHVLAGVQTLQA